MAESEIRVYSYRWIVLVVFMFILGMTQLLWITFAPITKNAAQFYGVSDLKIGLFSMSFMIVYVFVSIPASWVIDTYGFRVGVGIGAVLTGIFALTRGIFASDYNLVLLSQVGIAVGQPFVLNSITKVAARWFPINERATAAGLGSLALYLGIVAGMALTPYLTIKYGLPEMLYIYGIVSLISAFTFILLAREKPPTPPCPPGQEERALMLDGLNQMIRQKDFIILMVVFFVGLGIFNGVTTWIEDIIRPRGFTVVQAGNLGGLMVIGGIIGAVVMPLLSDFYRKRKPFILLALIGAIPGLLGITFATSYWLLLLSGFVFGFFILSAGPIGFQFGAELTYPAPEGTSNGLLILMGQISGIIFIFAMDRFKSPATGSMTPSMLILIGLMVLSLALFPVLRESPLIKE
ncbi:MAG: MFS transporter [Deltaproteobacteria bacterium]|nr:MAG: MFS transporter [Deltaproteobacteria bacterium]